MTAHARSSAQPTLRASDASRAGSHAAAVNARSRALAETASATGARGRVPAHVVEVAVRVHDESRQGRGLRAADARAAQETVDESRVVGGADPRVDEHDARGADDDVQKRVLAEAVVLDDQPHALAQPVDARESFLAATVRPACAGHRPVHIFHHAAETLIFVRELAASRPLFRVCQQLLFNARRGGPLGARRLTAVERPEHARRHVARRPAPTDDARGRDGRSLGPALEQAARHSLEPRDARTNAATAGAAPADGEGAVPEPAAQRAARAREIARELARAAAAAHEALAVAGGGRAARQQRRGGGGRGSARRAARGGVRGARARAPPLARGARPRRRAESRERAGDESHDWFGPAGEAAGAPASPRAVDVGVEHGGRAGAAPAAGGHRAPRRRRRRLPGAEDDDAEDAAVGDVAARALLARVAPAAAHVGERRQQWPDVLTYATYIAGEHAPTADDDEGRGAAADDLPDGAAARAARARRCGCERARSAGSTAQPRPRAMSRPPSRRELARVRARRASSARALLAGASGVHRPSRGACSAPRSAPSCTAPSASPNGSCCARRGSRPCLSRARRSRRACRFRGAHAPTASCANRPSERETEGANRGTRKGMRGRAV